MPEPPAARTVILAFDYGTRRIGVAVGQGLLGTASPAAAIRCGVALPWREIDHVVGEWQPQRLVVGLPYNMDGSPSSMTEQAREFGHRLEARYGLPVEFADERLTSREAHERLREARRSGRLTRRVRPADVDPLAACVIAEQWLAGLDERQKG
jgi:putative Holliday junction resolvase